MQVLHETVLFYDLALLRGSGFRTITHFPEGLTVYQNISL